MSAITARLSVWWRSREDDLDDVWPFLFAASLLYVFRLGSAPLWYDEAASHWFAGLPLARMIVATAGDTHPPLYYLLLAPLVHFFGASPAALRIPSVLFMLCSLYVARELARELQLSRTAQLIALGLMTLSPFQLHYAQEARMYALLQLLVLGATLAALRKQLLRFALLSALAMWAHNYGLFYFAVNCGVLAWAVWKTRPRWPVFETALVVAMVGGAALVMWLPWAAVLYGQMRTVAGGYWIMPVTWGTLIYALLNLMYAFTLPVWLTPTGVIVAVGLLTWLTVKAAQARTEAPLLLLWIVLAPALIALAVSAAWRPVWLFRGLAPSLPALCLLAGWAFGRVKMAYRLCAAFFLLPLLAAALVGQYLYTPDQKSQIDQVYLDKLLSQWQPGDLIVYSNEGYLVEWHPRGIERLPYVIMPRTCPQNFGAISETTRDALGMVVANPDTRRWTRAWFVYTAFPQIMQCEVDMVRAWLSRYEHRRVWLIQGDEFVEASIWLVTR